MKLSLILILVTLNVFGQKETDGKDAIKMLLTSSSSFSNYETVKINKIDFDLVLQDKDTIYLQTIDKEFVIDAGIHVGTKFSELPLTIKQIFTKERGWGYYYTLPSGWSIGFCEGNTCTNDYPNESSEIKWIFKRK